VTSVPAIRSVTGGTNDGGSSVVVAVPTGSTAPLVGDQMLVLLNFTSASSITAVPAGWTQVLAPSAIGSRYQAVYRATRASDSSNAPTWTMNTTGACVWSLIYGAAVYGFAGAFSKGASATTQTTPGVTTTKANCLAISLQAEATSATETNSQVTVASPFVKDLWTLQSGSSPINSNLIAHREMATAGATGDAVSSWLNPTGNRGSIMIVWEPVPDTVVPVVPLAAKVVDEQGNAADVGLTAIDASGKEVSLSKIEFVHGGTPVPDLDKTSRVWTMGHRGGSADYQEHSPEAYLNAAICHVDVLEFSVGITSDGVFFGIHDSTYSRTSSSVAAGVKTTDLTWAQVQALTQDLPNRGDSRYTTSRYMSLDEFINRWAGTHTLMFDPKLLSTANRKLLYDRIKQIPKYRYWVLGKFYHTGTAIADEFHAIGCKAWGYAYTEAITGFKTDGSATQEPLLSATAAKWDYLGMEYGATPAVWAETVRIAGGATGKRVIGHIVKTQDDAKSAVAKGARALQVAGIRDVSQAF
jgi:hypothetical protein